MLPRVVILVLVAVGFLPSGACLAEVSFRHTVVDVSPPRNPWFKLVGDVSGDGLVDLVVAGSKGPLVTYRWPDWRKTEIAAGGYDGVNGEIGDLDADGDLDIVMGGVVWFRNPGPSGGASAREAIDTRQAHDIELADLDGDGRLDVAARDQSAFGKTGDSVFLYRQREDGRWDRRQIACPHGEGLKLADLDRDGDADIVIAGRWYENQRGDASDRWPEHVYTAGWTHPHAKVETADLDADGRLDIVLAPAELAGQSYRLAWFAAPADARGGAWTEHVIATPLETVLHSLAIADFDRDGQPDVATAEMHQGADPDEVAIYFNAEHGARWRKQILATSGSHELTAADFGGDGDLDLVGANHGGPSQALELWENETAAPKAAARDARPAGRRPNILIAISDDQSWLHTSAAGSSVVRTPAFDEVARRGARFSAAFSPSPGCSPTRAALLTGRHIWQIEEAGTHASSFPQKYVTFPDLLEQSGYFIGMTGKGWGPGDFKVSGRERNPAGPACSKRKLAPPHKGISANDYAGNFADFLAARPEGTPFCFWFGATEPHRVYEPESWRAAGKRLEDAVVPPFLPDTPEVRSDLLNYAVEIEWFDHHLGRMLRMLGEAGELDNTLVIVTSDNGMSFPRAKANCYEYGIHMPLAIAWPARMPGGRTIDDLIGFVDIAATILDAARVAPPGGDAAPAGRSVLSILESASVGIVDRSRTAVYAGRERHSSARWHSLGYPQRVVRTREYLYIRNLKPERWPAGAPQAYVKPRQLGPVDGAYHDIDGAPTLDFLVAHKDDPAVGRFLHLAVDRRPAEELYDIVRDPGCLKNLADDPQLAAAKRELSARLDAYLRATGDPRMGENGDIFETYPRYSPLREFPEPDWAREHPEWVPTQPWLEGRAGEAAAD